MKNDLLYSATFCRDVANANRMYYLNAIIAFAASQGRMRKSACWDVTSEQLDDASVAAARRRNRRSKLCIRILFSDCIVFTFGFSNLL
ncbi:MAG: hypothetical protein FMNOHCHN_01557 [Ignavibacteriaceae bacterium]|nr:hypothetical protein [Ignavibacteriaceae bacterium]